MATIRKELRFRTGTNNGRPDYLIAGFETEEDFGNGNIKRRSWVHASLLNPVLFQQVKQYLNGSSYICLEPLDLARGKPGPSTPPESPNNAPDPSQPLAKPSFNHPVHGIRVPEYGQLIAHNVGGEWALSMIHKGTKDIIHEVIEWPESWPETVNVDFLWAEGFIVE